MAGKQHFAGLDQLRGVAAAAVMPMHEIGIFRPGLGPQIHANVAVDLFFMLSGFVLAFAYDRRLSDGMGWRAFMLVRLIRLYPMLVLATLLSAGVALLRLLIQQQVAPGESLWLLPAGLLLLPAGLLMGDLAPFRSAYDLVPFGGPSWSLLFELIASAAFATWLRRPGRAGLPLFLLALAGLIALVLAAGRIGLLGTQGYLGVPGGLFRMAVSFAIGVVLFRRGLADRFPRLPVAAAIVAGGALCCLPLGDAPVFDLLCVFVLFPLVICLGAQPLTSATAVRVCTLLGALSYPVYLLHLPVSRMVGFLAKTAMPSIGTTALIAASMAATVIASFAALYLYDEPVRRWLTARLIGTSQRVSTSPVTGALPHG